MSLNVESSSRSPVWYLGFSLILLAHLIWQLLNDAPPAWDMAFHQLKGWHFLALWRDGGPLAGLWTISFPYPPLYHWIQAVVLGVFGDTSLLPFLSNLLGVFLLSYCTCRIAEAYLSATRAAWAGLIVLCFPMVAWISRESLLDVPLAGWVAAAVFLVFRSRFFLLRRWTLLFGLVCAAGVLTKWTFPVYVILPLLFGLWKSDNRGRSFLNLVFGGMLALPVALIYYGPNLAFLAANYPTTEQSGLLPWKPYPRHGEPGLNNILGWIYYPRVLASYFLFLPLTLLFLGGWLYRKDEMLLVEYPGRAFLWFWLLGGAGLLTFVTPKDPRFIIPLAAPLAILLLSFWRESSRMITVVIVITFVQFLLVSFSVPLTPSKLALFTREGDTDFQTIQQEWVLFQSDYFGIVGPPRREDWHLAEIVGQIPEQTEVGFLPELPRFNVNGLQLQGARVGRDINGIALGNLSNWRERLRDVQLVVGKEGYQGLSFITNFNSEITQFLRSEGWEELGRWLLPDGSEAFLLRSPELGKTVSPSDAASGRPDRRSDDSEAPVS